MGGGHTGHGSAALRLGVDGDMSTSGSASGSATESDSDIPEDEYEVAQLLALRTNKKDVHAGSHAEECPGFPRCNESVL